MKPLQIAIFLEGLLITALLVIILLRQRVIVTPNRKSAVTSEASTKDVWNETVELENRFQEAPLFQLSDNEFNDPNRVQIAYEQSAQIAAEVGDELRRRSFYGAPACVEAYCADSSRWYFDTARSYEAWAKAIEAEQQTPTPNLTKEVIKVAAKGAVHGLLGGWTGVFSVLTEPSTASETPEARRIEALQADSDRLHCIRTYLNSERTSAQAFLGDMFGWQFDENV